MNSLICPISSETINRNVARITGFLMAAMVILYAMTNSIYIIFAIAIDFYIRAFTTLKISPFSWLAKQTARLFKLPVIQIDKAPKIFAARVGFLFTIATIILFYVNPVISLIVALILMCFALLEAFFNFCVGCVVYNYFVLPFYKKS